MMDSDYEDDDILFEPVRLEDEFKARERAHGFQDEFLIPLSAISIRTPLIELAQQLTKMQLDPIERNFQLLKIYYSLIIPILVQHNLVNRPIQSLDWFESKARSMDSFQYYNTPCFLSSYFTLDQNQSIQKNKVESIQKFIGQYQKLQIQDILRYARHWKLIL